MFADIRTVLWKEGRSLLRYQGRKSQLIVSLLTPLIVAVILPISFGIDWAETYFSLFVGILIPLIVVGLLVPDAVAGEWERHTLETLLASRLPDKAIMLGKILLSMVVGWAGSVLIYLFSILVLNFTVDQPGIVFYRWDVFLAQMVTSLAMAIMVAALGVLFSLKAPSVQIAQQNLFTVIMLPMMLLGFLPMSVIPILLKMPLGDQAGLRAFIENIKGWQVILVVNAILFTLDGIFLWMGFSRFQRAKLLSKE